MPVRKTESRLPAGFTIDKLSDNFTSVTPGVTLASFLSSPLGARRTQQYVVFVTDAALAATVHAYEWTFANGGSTTQTTEVGVTEFTPQDTGPLTVTLNLKDAASTTLKTLTLNQQVVALNAALEEAIDEQERNFPGAAHPDTSRELLNDLRPLVNVLLAGSSNELYNKAICCLAYGRALPIPAWRRNIELEDYATLLDTQSTGFYGATKQGFGVCRTRPQLLAMFLTNPATTQPYLNPAIELPSGASRRQKQDYEQAVETAFGALNENDKIDLFNLLRFPKSHFAMAKHIFDSLMTRYFPSGNIAQQLLDAHDAQTLLGEYEVGLAALPANHRLSPPAFTRRVFALFNNAVWSIPVTPVAGAAAGAGGGVPPAPAPVGDPEKIPEITFIAAASPNDNGFLRSAVIYHTTYALNPQTAESFEDMVHQLAAANTPIARLRIVSHFALTTGQGSQVFIKFFHDHKDVAGNDVKFTNWWYFKYATSDEEGLKAFFKQEFLPAQHAGFLSASLLLPNSTTNTTSTDQTDRLIFSILQGRSDPALQPFRLGTRRPTGATLTLCQWCADLYCLNHLTSMEGEGVFPTVAAAPLPAGVITVFRDFIHDKIEQMKTASGVMVAANVDGLNSAIASLTLADFPVPPVAGSAVMTFTIAGKYLENHDSLRQDLAIVRNRLNDSFVDIRGCRVGQDQQYMQALQEFFGNPGHLPTVSGPDWFQSFSILGALFPSTETQIDQIFSTGYSSSSLSLAAADIQREFSSWSGRAGLNAQLSFWDQLFKGDKFHFLTLSWRNQLPPIGMDAVELRGLDTLAYPDLIARLKEIFFIPAATGPSTTALNTFNTTGMPQVQALLTAENSLTPLSDASPQSDLQQVLTALQGVATALSQTLPAAPSPLTVSYLHSSLDQLKGALVTSSAITPLLDALKAKCADNRVGIRYFLGIGLALPIQRAAQEKQRCLVFKDTLQTDALKSFMQINWAHPLPANMTTAIQSLNPTGLSHIDDKGTATDFNDDDFNDTAKASQASWLAIDHQDSQTTINPEEEFHQHIITL